MLVNFVDLHLYPKRHLWTLQCTLMNYLWPSFLRITKVHLWTLQWTLMNFNQMTLWDPQETCLHQWTLMKIPRVLQNWWTSVTPFTGELWWILISWHFPCIFQKISNWFILQLVFSHGLHDFSGSSRLEPRKFIAKKCMDHSLKVSSLSEQN